MLRIILVSEKELSYINFKRLKTTYLILNQKVSVKPYGYDDICTDKNLTKDKQYQLVVVSIKRSIQWKKVNHKDFYFELLGINYFRTCKTLFYLQLWLY